MWFCICLLFKASFPDSSDDEPRWEESIRIFQAESEHEAVENAITLAKTEENTYLNVNEENVEWTFLGISNLSAIPEEALTTGIEILSKSVSAEKASELLKNKPMSIAEMIRKKALRVKRDT